MIVTDCSDVTDEPNEVNQISHVIQLSVAPVFLLTGVGAMLNVLEQPPQPRGRSRPRI